MASWVKGCKIDWAPGDVGDLMYSFLFGTSGVVELVTMFLRGYN